MILAEGGVGSVGRVEVWECGGEEELDEEARDKSRRSKSCRLAGLQACRLADCSAQSRRLQGASQELDQGQGTREIKE